MPNVLIYGGAGQLGSVVCKQFKSALWKVFSVDFRNSDAADVSLILKGNVKEDSSNVLSALKSNKEGLDAIISVAGGFGMGSIKDASVFDGLDKMLDFNLKSAVAAAHVASNTLNEGGLLVLTGASGALSPTPYFIPYGVSKAATHHLVKSLAAEGSGMPPKSTVAAILPVMLDTPQNRKDMPNGKFEDWTPLDTVANILVDWANGKSRPANGGLIVVKTENKNTTLLPQ